MQFTYLGEATFFEDRTDEFLAVAKSLEIEALCNVETEIKSESNLLDPVPPTMRLVEEQTIIPDQMEMQSIKRECVDL